MSTLPADFWDNLDDDLTYDLIAGMVDESGGIRPFAMKHLRNAESADRLGHLVRAQISANLNARGLATLPPELPNSQWAVVRVYRQGSPVSKVIDAVQSPSAQGDEALRTLTNDNNTALVEQMRVLLEK